MANVLASVAAFENEVRQERQTAGIKAAKASGKTWGGSKKGRRLKVTDEQVTAIKHLKSEGTSTVAIARTVGQNRSTVYRLLEA